MFFRVKNYFFERKIEKYNAAANRFLLKDLLEQKELMERLNLKDKNDGVLKYLDKDFIQETIETIEKRLKVTNRYSILLYMFRTDQKRRYMVNHNFFKFLKAIQYLYINSGVTHSGGVSLAPSGVYYAINKVEEAFDELTDISTNKT